MNLKVQIEHIVKHINDKPKGSFRINTQTNQKEYFNEILIDSVYTNILVNHTMSLMRCRLKKDKYSWAYSYIKTNTLSQEVSTLNQITMV